MSNEKGEPEKADSFGYKHFSDIPSERTRIVRAIGRPENPQAAESPDEAEALRAARLAQRTERERQIKRYQNAGLAYIRSMLRGDQQGVTEVWDRIVLKWLEGRLSTYDRSFSFRIFFKEVLRNEVRGYLRGRARDARLGQERLDSDFEPEDREHRSASEEFDSHFRSGMLQRALASLKETEERFFLVLQLQIEAEQNGKKQPRSSEIANALNTTEENARAIRKRARDAYAQAIIKETAEWIGTSDRNRVCETLADLGLLEYCERSLPEG